MLDEVVFRRGSGSSSGGAVKPKRAELDVGDPDKDMDARLRWGFIG
jgi:hypothetical protein